MNRLYNEEKAPTRRSQFADQDLRIIKADKQHLTRLSECYNSCSSHYTGFI